METIKLKCTAQEDFILVKKEKTEQTTASLDYIPGNIFRGIVAGNLFKNKNKKINKIIFSDKVQFGDAHLIINDKRSYKVPASFYYKKADKTKNKIINFYEITDFSEKLKQKRNGYIIKSDNGYYIDTVNYGGRMKSAREEKSRSSKEKGLFFHQYIKKGQKFAFEIIVKKHHSLITNALTENLKRIGKARGSEFGGRILIEKLKNDTKLFNDESNSFNKKEGEYNYIYAASNLCFLNKYGEFTATPSIEQLTGLKDTDIEIDWKKTQLWFRKFMPYNGFRKNWDAERLIIEKGAVFAIKNKKDIDKEFKKLVGCFVSEGYGKLLINPNFLLEKEITLEKYKQKKEAKKEDITIPNTNLINYLIKKFKKNELKEKIQTEVNTFLNTEKFNAKITSSQWSRIYKESSKSEFNKFENTEQIEDINTDIFNLLFNTEKGICTSGARNPWTENDITKLKDFLKNSTFKDNQIFALRILSKKMYTNKKNKS
ncbi:MAG TPA: hypothetical protein EYG89_05595 [Bacteroidia bacterium]|nr:hypothetical protein [Bacteroidia bacterium]